MIDNGTPDIRAASRLKIFEENLDLHFSAKPRKDEQRKRFDNRFLSWIVVGEPYIK